MKTTLGQQVLILASILAVLITLGLSAQVMASPPTQGTALSAAEITELLNVTNDWRQRYSVPAVTWDPAVAAVAQDWANHLAVIDQLEHRPNNQYGENIWWGAPSGMFGPLNVVNSWGSEVADYDFDTNTCAAAKACGHFTQLVWANTARIGCGKSTVNNGDYFVCNYDPPGNFVGEKPGAIQPSALIAPTAVPTLAATLTPTLTATDEITSTAILTATPEMTGTVTLTATTATTSTLLTTVTPTSTLTATITVTATRATFGAQATAGLSEADANAMLDAHNDWRTRHNVPPLNWDPAVAAVAQDWADHLAATGVFEHRQNNKYGENIWAGSAGFFAPTDAVSSWGSEVNDYDFDSNTCAAGKACGHFTQLVWANTSRVGCGKATGHGNDYIVCNYDPPGNFVGEKPGASPAATATSTPTILTFTDTPTPQATLEPTTEPLIEPTATPVELIAPTEQPLIEPTATEEPVIEPTDEPIVEPTDEPFIEETETPEASS